MKYTNCFAWQLAKANALAEKEGFAKFVSVQGHYNLIFREEEREIELSEEESAYLEELYVPHRLVGVMAYGVEQDRIRAMLPDGYTSLRPVLRINAEIRENDAYIEFNTSVSLGEKKGCFYIKEQTILVPPEKSPVIRNSVTALSSGNLTRTVHVE